MELPDDLLRAHVGGTDFTFSYVAGTMVQEKRWSETRVQGGGGGGKITKYGGKIDPIKIQSENDSIQEIWVQSADGTSTCLRISNFDVQVLEGHVVVAALAHSKNKPKGSVLAIRNLTTGNLYYNDDSASGMIKSFLINIVVRFGAPFLAVAFFVNADLWLWVFGSFFIGVPAVGGLADGIMSGYADDLRLRAVRVCDWVAAHCAVEGSKMSAS